MKISAVRPPNPWALQLRKCEYLRLLTTISSSFEDTDVPSVTPPAVEVMFSYEHLLHSKVAEKAPGRGRTFDAR